MAEHGEPVLVEDTRNDPRFTAKVDELTHTQTRSIVCVPIKAHDHVLGVIELVNALGKPSFGMEDIPILKSLADCNAAIALVLGKHRKDQRLFQPGEFGFEQLARGGIRLLVARLQ